MSTIGQAFHHFSRLPIELREEIWRCCIPSRTRELDTPLTDNVFWGQPQPCQLQSTSGSNSDPPLITRVCHESRRVAYETGVHLVCNADSSSPDWDAATAIYTTWQDPLRESLHLNWARVYEADFYNRGHPLEHLVRLGEQAPGSISFTGEYLFQSVTKDQDLELLNQRAEWSVVVRTIIVHSDIRSAAATGLFGLLGDSRVQIIDASNVEGIERFLDLARSCEQGRDITTKQDFRPETVCHQTELLRKHTLDLYGESLTTNIRPAVMFRLCTQMCNDRAVEGARERTKRAQLVVGRGRGRGRVSRADYVI